MAKRKSKNASRGRRHQARKNPLGRPRRHRKNPFVGDSASNNVRLILGASGGLLADVYVPAWILGMMGQPDSGLTSYAIAALTVLLPAWALHKFNFTQIAKGWLAGAGAGFVWRVTDDLTGQKYVTVQSGMSSFYVNQPTVLPGPNVFGAYGRRPMLPASTSASTVMGKGSASSTLAVSKPASGMGWARYPYAA